MLFACNQKSDISNLDRQNSIDINVNESKSSDIIVNQLRAEYENAWVWDSLNFEFTYSFQLAIDSTPIVIIPIFHVVDVWRSDSTTKYLILLPPRDGYTRKFFMELTCAQTEILERILPNPMQKEDITRRHFPFHIEDENRISIVARIQEINRLRFPASVAAPYPSTKAVDAALMAFADGNLLDSNSPFFLKGQILAISDSAGFYSIEE
jgi:hypothetical protein